MFISHSPHETEALGEAWGGALAAGTVLGLTGDLGSGKTQLVRGLARGLGITARVHSPTFALVHEYPGGRLALAHLDLYRLATLEQIVGAGLEEYLAPRGVTVIEWAERVADVLPADHLWITFRYLDDAKRRLTLTPSGDRYRQLLKDFQRLAFGVRSR